MVGTEGSLKTLSHLKTPQVPICIPCPRRSSQRPRQAQTSYESEFDTILSFKAFHLLEMKSFLNFRLRYDGEELFLVKGSCYSMSEAAHKAHWVKSLTSSQVVDQHILTVIVWVFAKGHQMPGMMLSSQAPLLYASPCPSVSLSFPHHRDA